MVSAGGSGCPFSVFSLVNFIRIPADSAHKLAYFLRYDVEVEDVEKRPGRVGSLKWRQISYSAKAHKAFGLARNQF